MARRSRPSSPLPADFTRRAALSLPLALLARPFAAAAGGRTVVLPFLDESEPLGRRIGTGEDARLYADLASLSTARPLTPAPTFFVRTDLGEGAAPPAGPLRLPDRTSISHEQLFRSSRDRGPVTLECAGNVRQAAFGLLSRARFAGVPLSDLLSGVPSDALVECHGAPRAPGRGPASTSWIFRMSDLVDAGAFVATSLGGKRLTGPHGAPIRLVVPGWFGCCAIKWLHSIERVPPDAPPSRQMAEYASRTHQDGVPDRAADYRPARMELAAVVTRVTRANGQFTAEGIVWGGSVRVAHVDLRVNGEDAVRASVVQAGGARENWGFFRARFDGRPAEATLDARADEPVPQPRVDARWYERRVALDGI